LTLKDKFRLSERRWWIHLWCRFLFRKRKGRKRQTMADMDAHNQSISTINRKSSTRQWLSIILFHLFHSQIGSVQYLNHFPSAICSTLSISRKIVKKNKQKKRDEKEEKEKELKMIAIQSSLIRSRSLPAEIISHTWSVQRRYQSNMLIRSDQSDDLDVDQSEIHL